MGVYMEKSAMPAVFAVVGRNMRPRHKHHLALANGGLTPTAKRQLHALLVALGLGQITVTEFWRHMKREGLTDKHVDRYCRGERRPPERADRGK